MLSLLKTGCALAVVAAAGVCVAGAPLSFTGVGTLPGSVTSRATAISPDGQVVGAAAGTAGGNPAAFLYMVGSGQRLAVQNGATSLLGLSTNGGRAVGVAGTRGYTFEAPGGPFVLPYPTSGSIAGISANGNVTAGWYEGFGAFRRTGADDPFSLESLSGFPDMTVSGCSGNGSVVVGTAGRIEPGDPDLGTPDLLYFEAAKVVDEGAWVGLGVLPGVVPITPTESYANGVSADGSTVVGTSLVSRAIPDSTDIAYIYTAFKHQGGAMTPLLSLAGELGFGEALDATADGSVVVGSGDGGSSATGSSATMWVGTSPQDVKDLLVAILTAAGRSTSALDNWSLTSCTAISDDGAWLAGDGLFMGVAQGWVARIVEEPAFVVNPPSVVGVNLGGTLALSVEASGTPVPTYQWYTGQPGSGTALSDNGGTIMGAGTSQLFIHGITPAAAGSTYYCVATSALGTATSTVATLVVYTPAFFTSGLPPTTGAVAGSDVTFSLTATGTPEPAFQWYKGTPGSGTPISDSPGVASGATTPSLTLINVQPSAAGDYYCVAQNIVSSSTSTATTLTIVVPPAITMNPPAKVIVRSGDEAQFAVSASGSPAPMFAWSKGTPGSGTNLMDDGTSIEGAQTPTLTLRSVSPDAAGTYYCTAYIFGGYFANSTASRLIVNTGPVITAQPAPQTRSLGETATFTVAIDGKALGTDNATYAWQKNGANIDLPADARFTVDHTSGNFADSTLTISDLRGADAGVYSVLITGPSGTTQSDDADLTVLLEVPVQITQQPVPLQRKSVGGTATFTVMATGVPPPDYRWFRRRPTGGNEPLSDGPTDWGSALSGTQTNELTITNLTDRVRPNAATHEIAQLPGVATGGSPRGFVMLDVSDLVPGPDTLYVLDDGDDAAADAGLYKYTYDSTLSRWVLTGYAPLDAGGGGRLSGLSGLLAPPDSLGTGSPPLVILALTARDGDILLFAVDEPVYGSDLGAFMVVDGVAAPTDTKFRGTGLVLLPFGPTPVLGLIASRVGDGVAPLSDTGSPVFLDVFGFGSATVPVRSNGPGTKLILDGTAPDEGQLAVSPDGRFIVLAGYNAELGGMDPLAATGAGAVPRSVAVLDLLDGGLNLSTSLPDFADQGHPRGAATDDGVNLWLVGSTGGLQYTTIGSNSSILLTAASPTDLRTVAIFGDQLHVAAVFDPVRRGTHGPAGAPPPEPIRIGSVDPAPPLGSDFGTYFCRVGGAGPTRFSEDAVLENADNPEVQQGPQDVIATAGASVSFTATLSSDEDGTDCTYNWFRNGVPIDFGSDLRITINPISGSDSMSVLTIDPVMETDAGFFSVAVRRSAGGGSSTPVGANLTVGPANACRLDYTPDGSVNSDDLGDFITDYFTDPPVAGPNGYATPCPGNDPPYDAGYKAAFTLDRSPQCFQPNSDNLGDFITEYFSTGNNCGNNGP